ncbi:hypothetical protein [Rhodoferax sp. GW822-FHT02A01]|uniref:hypothetical protein n=1 Tax=Rhodoferax sp. GW822-FHT02A01 TaxID=3141537 RepID=UPI00315D8E9F
MHDHIINYLSLQGQHTRSVSLLRDLDEDRAISNYMLTPNSLGALRQIGEGLASGAAQRAWKIVGPYGSGKSALGVILAQLLAGPLRHAPAAQKLETISPKIAALFKKSHRFTIPIVGARLSFGVALAKALADTAEKLGSSKPIVAWLKHLNLGAGTYKSQPLNAIAGEMAHDFSKIVTANLGFNGLTLLIDEVGKFVEYAALHPEHGDLIALQQVAEIACAQGRDELMVVAMLHQHFASYAAGVGRTLSDEWHKIAARFEEIPFDEPVERYAHFASHSLGMTSALRKHKELVLESNDVYSKAISQVILRAPSQVDKDLFKHSESLYPLHPLALSALATISKRYGQSERSFHAFLSGNEPKGLREFASVNSLGTWFRLPDLYDYLAEGYGLRFRDLSAERRWEFSKAAVDRHSGDVQIAAVLKAVAIFELAQSGLVVPATAEAIAYALGKKEVSSTTQILNDLVEKGVLVERRKIAEYGVAVSDTVNIEALYEQAAQSNESELVIRGVSKALSQRLIVANRHYAETGTLRTMGVLVGTPTAWPQVPTGKTEESGPDAWLKLVLTPHDASIEKNVLRLIKDDDDVRSITARLPITNEGRAALAEYAIWQAISIEVNSKRLDPWTSRYVEGRLSGAAEVVERLVTSALMPLSDRAGLAYWHAGRAIPGGEFMNASQLASWLFNKIYDQTPRVVNELINKDKPASAIVLARQRMFDVILSGDPERKICGESDFPPERLIHTTLLRETGLWREESGRWSLQSPSETAQVNISAVWDELSEQLRSSTALNFGQMLDAIAAPPFGVRAGPAGIWIVLYLLVNRNRCAVFERGTLVLELTAEHLQRMYKNPSIFTMRELDVAEESKSLLNDYRSALAAIGSEIGSNPTYLNVARTLFRWFTRLPEYTMQTQQISKDAALVRTMLSKATDPIELLTNTLRKAYLEAKSKLSYADWLANALTNLGMAHRRLQDTVAAELSKGFGISGPLNRVRNQLQAECSKDASKLADAKLKSFILRCTDLLLTDEKWLDSVGSLIVQRPLDSWVDDTVSKFQQGLTELCGHYRRWMQLVMRRGEAPAAANRYLGLTLTSAEGEETSVFVTTNESTAAMAKELVSAVVSSSKGDREVAEAVLAQALLDLRSEKNKPIEGGVRHG